jgi:hypothetical protein
MELTIPMAGVLLNFIGLVIVGGTVIWRQAVATTQIEVHLEGLRREFNNLWEEHKKVQTSLHQHREVAHNHLTTMSACEQFRNQQQIFFNQRLDDLTKNIELLLDKKLQSA